MKIRIAILAVCASALFLTQSYVAQAKDDGIVINLPWSKGDPLKKKKEGSSRTVGNPAPQYGQKANGRGISENESPRPRDR